MSKPRSRYQDLAPHDLEEIARLARQEYGSRAIARRLGLSRKIVRRVLEEAGLTSVTPPRGRKIDPFLEQIDQGARKGLSVARIFRDISAMGYQGGRTILGDRIRQVKTQLPQKARRRTAKRRFETAMGEEMQVDWSPETVMIAGHPTRIHLLGVILAHSRRLFIGIYRNEREATLLEGLATAFE